MGGVHPPERFLWVFEERDEEHDESYGDDQCASDSIRCFSGIGEPVFVLGRAEWPVVDAEAPLWVTEEYPASVDYGNAREHSEPCNHVQTLTGSNKVLSP